MGYPDAPDSEAGGRRKATGGARGRPAKKGKIITSPLRALCGDVQLYSYSVLKDTCVSHAWTKFTCSSLFSRSPSTRFCTSRSVHARSRFGSCSCGAAL